jgi:hypothetical protein
MSIAVKRGLERKAIDDLVLSHIPAPRTCSANEAVVSTDGRLSAKLPYLIPAISRPSLL